MQKIFNADYKLALPLLLLFLFLLSGFIPAEHNQAARKASEHAIVQASGSMAIIPTVMIPRTVLQLIPYLTSEQLSG